MDKEILTKKYELVTSPEYQKIRALQLDNIVSLSNGAIDPLIIKGMLKNIYDTDQWKAEYLAEKEKQKKE